MQDLDQSREEATPAVRLDLLLLMERCQEHYWRQLHTTEALVARLSLEAARMAAEQAEHRERRRALRRELAALRETARALRETLAPPPGEAS